MWKDVLRFTPLLFNLLACLLVIFAMLAPNPLDTENGVLMSLVNDNSTVPNDEKAQILFGVFSTCVTTTNGAHICSNPSTVPNFNETITNSGILFPSVLSPTIPQGWRLTPGALIGSIVLGFIAMITFVVSILPLMTVKISSFLQKWWSVLLKITLLFQFVSWLLYFTVALQLYTSVLYYTRVFNEFMPLVLQQAPIDVTRALVGNSFTRFWLAVTFGGLSMFGIIGILVATPSTTYDTYTF